MGLTVGSQLDYLNFSGGFSAEKYSAADSASHILRLIFGAQKIGGEFDYRVGLGLTVRPRIRASALHGMHVSSPAFADIHCVYTRRNGQAELTSVAGDGYPSQY